MVLKDMAFPFQLGEAPQAAAEVVVDARKRTFDAAEVALAVRVVEADGRDGCDNSGFLIQRHGTGERRIAVGPVILEYPEVAHNQIICVYVLHGFQSGASG